MRFLILVLLLAVELQAVTRHVSKTGANSGSALTEGTAWLTMIYAEAHMNGGDKVIVHAGEYNERVVIAGTSGSSDNYTTWIADGVVTCRGFTVSSVDYVKIVGFNISALNTSETRGVRFDGTGSYINVLGNYIHNTHLQGIGLGTPTDYHHVWIGFNTVTNAGIVSGVVSNVTTGISGGGTNTHHWLVEYNKIGRAGDYVILTGTDHIVRNNTLLDFQNSYWNTTDLAHHSDGFQSGSDGQFLNIKRHLYEANFAGDQVELNSHYALHQDQDIFYGDTNILHRGNVAFNFGSGGIGVIGTDHVISYRNTFYKTGQLGAGAVIIFYKGGSTDTNWTYDNFVASTLIYDSGLSSDALVVGSGVDSSTATFVANWGYLGDTEASYVGTTNPLLGDPTAPARNFHLGASSPLIGVGTNLVYITSANGSGTSFDVNDAFLVVDGWGIVDGDIVTIGAITTRVTSVSGITVTVADSVTWTTGQAVHWGSNSSEDIGALPYGSADLTGAEIYNVGDTYTVTTTGDTRGVWFYVNGIPTTWDATSPYTQTFTPGDIVTAKACARYAQAEPSIDAEFVDAPIDPSAIPARIIRGGVSISGSVRIQ